MCEPKLFGFKLCLLFCGFCLANCSGTIADRQAGGGDDDNTERTGGTGGGGTGGGAEPGPSSCEGIHPGSSSPVVRLTNRQYRNAVRDLFSGVALPDVSLPSEPVFEGLDNDANAQSPTPQFIEAYEAAANKIADAVGKTPAQLVTALGLNCNITTSASTCGASTIERLATRAYRRTLDPAELSRLSAFYKSSLQGADVATALRATTARVLQSPQFLYRIEVGEAVEGRPDLRRLTSRELAARLSFLLWETLPDAELSRAADEDSLQDGDTLRDQVNRLLADPRSAKSMASFTGQWLGFSRLDKTAKDTKLFPAFNDQMKTDLRSSLEAYVSVVLNPNDGNVRKLLTDNRAFVNASVASIYGISGISGSNLRPVELDGNQRSGLLTQAGLLAALAKPQIDSPVLRGIYVRENLLCSPIPPPVGIDTTLPAAKPGDAPRTTREIFERSHNRDECASCHRYIDGIGYGFGHYDALGKWRDLDNGLPVDSRGELIDVSPEVDGAFDGAIELSQRLSTSQELASCLATNFFRFALSHAETEEDECARVNLIRTLMTSEGDIKSMVLELVQGDAFRYRSVAP